MIEPLYFAAVLVAAPAPPATFDGYAFGMSIADAEQVAPGRRSFECGRLMTSRCIVYERHVGAIAAVVSVQFSLDDRRIDRIEIVPREAGGRGAASCDAAWTGLISFLGEAFGAPRSREGNTMHWRTRGIDIAASVLQEEDTFCDIAAALTKADEP